MLFRSEHSETKEPLVIYQALYGRFQTYARPLEMFVSPVDVEKYPNAPQEYRFQLTEPQEGAGTAPDSKGGGVPKNSLSGGTPEEKMMAFFDARTMEEKYGILLEMRSCITDLMINNMAVVLDVVIEEGELDQRYEELKHCVRTFQKYGFERFIRVTCVTVDGGKSGNVRCYTA